MKSILSAGALLLCSTLAHAQTNNWTFSYTGFYDREAQVFLADATLQGSFSGVDGNADGILDRTELTSLLVGSMDYIACGPSSNAYYHCGADSFTFSSSGLSFSVGEWGSDPEGWVGAGRLITTGDADFEYQYNPSSNFERHLMWTDATQLTLNGGGVRPSILNPVPEPSTWAMLLAGLALGGVRLLRRKG